jgi:quercetin dioxygenase-like cupin family protein
MRCACYYPKAPEIKPRMRQMRRLKRKNRGRPTNGSVLAAFGQLRRDEMAGMSFLNSIGIATIGILYMLQAQPAAGQEKRGVIPHAPLFKSVLPDTANLEVAVYETEYAPGGINPRHLHPAAITFYVLSGEGVWQEEGKPPITLRAGDSLFVPAGTNHSHWNPSTTDRLRFLEFIVAEKDKGRSIPQPPKD